MVGDLALRGIYEAMPWLSRQHLKLFFKQHILCILNRTYTCVDPYLEDILGRSAYAFYSLSHVLNPIIRRYAFDGLYMRFALLRDMCQQNLP